MDYLIQNDHLKVRIASLGAELQSIATTSGTEYLWQGDPLTWPDKAINIFPYVARLTDGKYRYQDKEYQMPIHGFLSGTELEVSHQTDSLITFTLLANDATKNCYPFTFRYSLQYCLINEKIHITTTVENLDDKTMFFGIGGHPGFQVPIGGVGNFEDYYLEFSEACDVYRVGISDDGFVTEQDEPFHLKDERYLNLNHHLFDQDAIILRDMCKKVTLASQSTDARITVTYPDMDYLGIWHWPRTTVNYICIEPWSSLPSRKGIIEDIETQDNLIRLDAGKIYQNKWDIQIY